ncbi:P-loop containing nucleoside triphosphate hydrolase protein [Elsinoe ampelina]|uniref:Origin recognition complex subunit 1 n=1 Tax=Elsinoe ampelina TaxID=302913 RepID=A0A6A6GB70_9PEZI|nr:P-loop containing nucleoside triphosphate hydrolase protein [Elsinoe ampelina]
MAVVREKRKRSKTEKALQILQKGAVLREDSDDELGVEDHPWEWIHDGAYVPTGDGKDEGPKIVGARMGNFQCAIGDAVLLKAAGNEAWVAIVTGFSEGEIEDDEGEMIWSKKASFLWFSSEKEIKNSAKKRDDALWNELYITHNTDENSLATINGKATVISHAKFLQRYPSGRIPRGNSGYGKTFVCRRGCNPRTTSYTDEFNWEDVYRGSADIDSLVSLVESQTVQTRKRKPTTKASEADLNEFVVGDEEVEGTPRKRRKLDVTPKNRAEKKPKAALLTPTHRRIIAKKPLSFTPLGTRIISDALTASPHQQARSTLHVSAVPTSLPCRENEFSQIYTHLESAISTSTGSTIYISGTPGTGKTATVREVVASLNVAVASEELDDFIFVEINGMKVTDPHQSYSLLWQALKGQRVSPSHALELLEREFSTPSPRRTPCVVLMDELDQLVTRNQGVMYNFFNWPQLRHSRLIVLAVANTMDLPERTLSNKISSRLGLTRITFPGYTHQQLIKIITSRLEGIQTVVVDPDAVQFASRKVAAVSGDARRALDVCRRAVEMAEEELALLTKQGKLPPDGIENRPPGTPSKTPPVPPGRDADDGRGKVTIATIKKAISEATSTPLAAYLRSLPLSSKVFLAALLARIRRTGVQEALVGDVLDDARRIGLVSQLVPVERYLLAADEAKSESEWLGLFGEGEQIQGGAVGGGAGLLGTPGRRGRHAIKRAPEKRARVKGMGAAAVELAEAGIVGLENRRGERVGRVRLGVGEEDVRGALREDEESRGLGFSA